jgi:hypothetical protein
VLQSIPGRLPDKPQGDFSPESFRDGFYASLQKTFLRNDKGVGSMEGEKWNDECRITNVEWKVSVFYRFLVVSISAPNGLPIRLSLAPRAGIQLSEEGVRGWAGQRRRVFQRVALTGLTGFLFLFPFPGVPLTFSAFASKDAPPRAFTFSPFQGSNEQQKVFSPSIICLILKSSEGGVPALPASQRRIVFKLPAK